MRQIFKLTEEECSAIVKWQHKHEKKCKMPPTAIVNCTKKIEKL